MELTSLYIFPRGFVAMSLATLLLAPEAKTAAVKDAVDAFTPP
jgi:hypothetical protein